MNLKLVIAAALLAATPVFAQGQMAPQQKAPKPTVAKVKQVIDAIAKDKAKVQAYCQMNKLQDQMAQVDQKDQKKMAALEQQANAQMDKLGPDFGAVMDGLQSVDENSPEGKQFAALFAPLDSQCK